MTNEEMAVVLDIEAEKDWQHTNRMQECLRAGAAALRALEWRPIESAPKDGGATRLIVRGRYAHPFDPGDERDACAEAYYSNLLKAITYKDWRLKVAPDLSYLQWHFDADGQQQHCRKWMLSEHMTPSEIVQTAFKAVLSAEEHEAREKFNYKGRAVFGPHFNVEELVGLSDKPNCLDARKPKESA